MSKKVETRSDDLYAIVSYCGGGRGQCTASDPYGKGGGGNGKSFTANFTDCIDQVVGPLGASAGNPQNAKAVSQAGIGCGVVATINTNW